MSGPATQKARLPNCVLLRFTAHGSGSSSEGAKLAYIRVGRSKHDKVTEVRRASTVESLMHNSSNFEGDTVLDRQPV